MKLKSDLVEARNSLDAKKKKLAEAFSEAGPDYDMDKVKCLGDQHDSKAKVEAIAALNKEITDGAEAVKKLADAVKALDGTQDSDDRRLEHEMKHRNSDGGFEDDGPRQVSLGKMFADSIALKEKRGHIGPVATLPVPTLDGMKTLMTTSAGWAPQSIRTGLVVPKAVRPIQVIDLIPMGRTGMASVVYMEETTFTNNAAETAEAGTYPESALALTQQTSPVQKTATFLPVTDEQLEDVEGIESYVDNRLTFMLRQRLDLQITSGNGTTPNLRGLLNVSGIQTQAKGADPTPDAVYKAMTNIRVNGRGIADSLIMHPTDWQAIKLLRTTDGIYIWGSPADVGPDRIWGLNVAQADSIATGTAIVFDSSFTNLVMRRDIEVQVSNSHSTYFIEGKQAIRADMRCAFVVYRPAVVCTVTGL